MPRYRIEVEFGNRRVQFVDIANSPEEATFMAQEFFRGILDQVPDVNVQAKAIQLSPRIIAFLNSPVMEVELTEDGVSETEPELPLEFECDGFIPGARLERYVAGLRKLYPNITFEEERD